jgi:sodium/bile acid cotransporter 7
MRRILPDPFVLALLATVAVAFVLPARGQFSTLVDTIATAAIVLLFFLHGVRMPRDSVIAGVANWRLHSLVLSSTFVVFPLLGLALFAVARPLLPDPLWIGVLFLCAVPSTVQSSIAFTSIAGGNVPGAIAAATFSNLLGIVITPLLALLLLSAQGSGLSLAGLGSIVSQLLLPFIIGHYMRPWLGSWAARRKKLLAVSDRTTIILAVYSAFSAAVVGGVLADLEVDTLLALLGLCAVLLTTILVFTRYSSRWLGFSREDEIATVFCGSKKTLASGVPMGKILFPGPDLGAILLPLIIFHQLQLIVCAWLARRYARSLTQHGPGEALDAARKV